MAFSQKKTWWLVVVGLLFNTRPSIALAQGQECVNPAGKTGRCILFRECQPLLEIYNKRLSSPDDRSYLVSSRCGELDRKALVCCASVNDKPQAAKRTLPEAPNCGIQLSDRIVGGQETQLDEFPWSALIEYRKEDGSHDFHCGGTLINERYIVTAAHCVQSLPRGWMVYRVRLGEWDLASITDCQGGICSPAPVNREVESVLAHPGYSYHDTNHYDDIALVRFTQNVHFSGTIRPICLPVSASLRTRFTDGASSYAAGWGKTEYASANLRKLKVELTMQHLQKCLPVYQRIGIALRSTQMCAGGVQGKDTCNGDSGGPLMGQARGAWYLLGVISFGLKNCGSAGVPGVYTNMAEYIDWIRDNIY